MKQYLELLKDVLENGEEREDRTGTGTLSLFGRQLRFDLREGFPLVTTKKIHVLSVVHELLWFLKGSTDNNLLAKEGVNIWTAWAKENGDLGRIYGKQWRAWGDQHDQIATLMKALKEDPYSRRHIVSAWNVGDLDKMALAPCHTMFQFYVHKPKQEGGKLGLSCHLYQRSADIFLGVPFNIASYSLLTMMVAEVLGYEAREFIHSFGDVHLYNNHVEQAVRQLKREPHPLPEMVITVPEKKGIDGFAYGSFELINYQHHETIKATVAV